MKKRLGDLTLDQLAELCRTTKCEGCPLLLRDDEECVIVDELCPAGWPLDKRIEIGGRT